MDDVLSSIRRIIGSDAKKDDGGEAPLNLEPGGAQEPLALGTPIQPGSIPEAPRADSEAMPLTPNMRVDFSKLTDENPLSGASPAAEPTPAPAPHPAAEPVDFLRSAAAPEEGAEAPEESAYPDDEAVVIDEAALEEMIRRIVREELAAQPPAAPPPAAPPDDEAMRQVVREELMGETGQNISRNVQSLIQAEVSRLLADKG